MRPEIFTAIPGPKSLACARKVERHEARGITFLSDRFPIFWDRAEGGNVWDVDGNRFLDFTSAFAVAGLGHSAPSIRKALVTQAGKLLHAMGDVHPAGGKADLCEALSRVTFERWGAGPGKVFLCNSGSEAVEAALKTALLHNGKPGVLSFQGGYHGLGYGALEVSGIAAFREPFRSQLARFAVHLPYPNCYRCPFGCTGGFRIEGREFPNCSATCLIQLEEEIHRTLARREIGSILVEPIQGRGGEIVPPRDFLTLLRRICDEQKIPLILDEIYTGFHRTGRFFACEHFDVMPDMICLGKALTGGFPLAACVGRADVMDAWPTSTGEALHTSTMLGNPLGCAMAIAAISEHEKAATREAAIQAGRILLQGLRSLRSAAIGDIRGVGAMIGIELVHPDGSPDPDLTGRIVVEGLAAGLILLGGGPAGNVLSFSPPFCITEDDVQCLVTWLATAGRAKA